MERHEGKSENYKISYTSVVAALDKAHSKHNKTLIYNFLHLIKLTPLI